MAIVLGARQGQDNPNVIVTDYGILKGAIVWRSLVISHFLDS